LKGPDLEKVSPKIGRGFGCNQLVYFLGMSECHSTILSTAISPFSCHSDFWRPAENQWKLSLEWYLRVQRGVLEFDKFITEKVSPIDYSKSYTHFKT